jgi:hypothetical protein
MKIEPVMGNIKESKLLRVIEQKVLDEFNKNILQTSYKNIPFKEIPSLEMISYDYIYCSSFPLIGFMGLDLLAISLRISSTAGFDYLLCFSVLIKRLLSHRNYIQGQPGELKLSKISLFTRNSSTFPRPASFR